MHFWRNSPRSLAYHACMRVMLRFLLLVGILTTISSAQDRARGPYARIAVLRPHDGDTVEFEAGYIRHLEWHRQARDPWTWYGWTVWAGDRQRWFVYATFGHTAADFDSPVSPADDERDNIFNVTSHCQFMGNAVYEYLPSLSHGTGQPQPMSRLEMTTVDLLPDAPSEFEAACQIFGHSRRKRAGAPGEGQRRGQERNHRDFEFTSNNELWSPGGSMRRNKAQTMAVHASAAEEN